MTNLAKLRDAYAKLGWAQDNIKHEGKVDKILIDEIKRLIHEFMVDNEPTPKKGTFNIWDWIANDPLRPVLNGVLHDKENQVAVATNAHILVACAESYDESKVDSIGFDLEKMKVNRPVDKYGKFIDGRFPNWKAVIPPKDGYVEYDVDMNDLSEYIKKSKAWMKLEGYTGKYATPLYKVGPAYFAADMLHKTCIASGGKLSVKNDSSAAVYFGEQRTALIMPVLAGDYFIQEAREVGILISVK